MDVEPPPSQELERCRLLGRTALIVQGIMGLLVISSLVVKRHFEKRKRPWRIWIWDVGKQLSGQAVIHALNLLISDQIALAGNNNPCSLYFLNVLIDTTIGVIILYFGLKVFTWLFTVRLGYEGFISGQYGKPPRPIFWWKQLAPYLMAIVLMKLLILLPLTLPRISTSLLNFSHFMLDYLSPSVQVVFAMAIFPVVMNIVQFCIVDQIIKSNHDPKEEEEEDILEAGEYELVDSEDVEQGRKSFAGTSSITGTPMTRRNSSRTGSPVGKVSTSHDEFWLGVRGGSEAGGSFERDRRRSGAPSPEDRL